MHIFFKCGRDFACRDSRKRIFTLKKIPQVSSHRSKESFIHDISSFSKLSLLMMILLASVVEVDFQILVVLGNRLTFLDFLFVLLLVIRIEQAIVFNFILNSLRLDVFIQEPQEMVRVWHSELSCLFQNRFNVTLSYRFNRIFKSKVLVVKFTFSSVITRLEMEPYSNTLSI